MKRVVFLLVIGLAACSGSQGSPTTSLQAVTTSSTTPVSTLPPIVDCPGGGDFAEGTGIAVFEESVTDASDLARISWEVNDQCESFVFEFRTDEGAPATVTPPISVDHLESFQVIRIETSIGRSTIVDQLVETPLVNQLYAIAALNGSTFIDLHLAAPSAVRARVESSPARLVIDLRPGLVEFAGASSVGQGVVTVSPTEGAEVESVTTVEGYFQAFDSDPTVTVQVDGVTVSTEVADRASSIGWTEFRHVVTLPEGSVTILVGDSLGAPDLLALNLTVR